MTTLKIIVAAANIAVAFIHLVEFAKRGQVKNGFFVIVSAMCAGLLLAP